MSRAGASSRIALAIGLLLASLSLVAWRQSRAFEVLAALEEVRREASLARAERSELERRIRHLESRGRVVAEARVRLGMHLPDATEIVYLAGSEE